MRRLVQFLGASLCLLACGGEEAPIGRDEPILVQGAYFKEGKMPEAPAAVADERPRVTYIELGTSDLKLTAQGIPLRGGASLNAYSVGVQLQGQGSGYWVFPVRGEDPIMPGVLEWGTSFDVGAEVEPGRYKLALAAFDKAGKAGAQSFVDVCVLRDIPDNRNVCDPTREPPEAIATLRWNADVDMDLSVLAPDGTRYGRQKYGEYEDGKPLWTIDADASAVCVGDGRRIENFVWHKRPPKGTWYIYANLFDACGDAAVSFELTTYRKKTHDDGTFSLEEERVVAGELLRAQTKADHTTPLYLTRITF
jgi:hypothetical protein